MYKRETPDKDIAAILGRKRDIVVGKMSGRTSIKVKMKQLGLPLPEEDDLNQILSRVKERSIAIHDSLSDDEFKSIVSEVVNH